MDVNQAVKQRISTRVFLPTPIPANEIQDWLSEGQRSPSGGNLQPWKVIVLAGDAKQAVIDLAQKRLSEEPTGEATDRPIYPPGLWNPYEARRRRLGEMMYEKMGIKREDKVRRSQWFARNFRFFDAPIGLLFIIDERMGHGQWAHTGMFMQTLALLAEERGWGTCMQECWGALRPSLKAHLGLNETDMVYCGMSLGLPDRSAPLNDLYTERERVDHVAEFRGF